MNSCAYYMALVSDDPQKPKTLAKQYKVNHCYNYEEYSDCLNSDEIDAVYIALPNNMHLQADQTLLGMVRQSQN